MSGIEVLVTCPCDACGVRPCGEDDILCVECRDGVRARRALAKGIVRTDAERETLAKGLGYASVRAMYEPATVTMRGRVIVDEPFDRDGTPGKACLACESAWPAHEQETDLSHASGCSAAPMPPGDVDAVLDCLLGEEIAVVCPMVMPCLAHVPTCATCKRRAA